VTELPLRTRALLYLYSTRNIVACCAALLGPALLFAGVIRDFWLPITAGLYIAAYLAIPAPKVVDVALAQELSFEDLLERLNDIIKQARPQLQQAMVQRLDSIRASVNEVLPRLARVQGFDDDLFTVRETILRYLPETLANYAALPPMFRNTHPLKEGKTARTLLTEQLSVLDEQMKQVVANVAGGDAQALLANGQFLEAKFKERDFLKAS